MVFKEEVIGITKMFLFLFSFEIIYLHKVPMIWWMWFGKLGTYIKGKRVVDLAFSKSSKYLRIKVSFF